MTKSTLAVIAGALLLAPVWDDVSHAATPNVIVIFADDQGYQDLGCFGSPRIKTPNIDRMAREGMRFTDFYVGAPVCTPSRVALLTGSYPARAGGLPVLFPNARRGMNPDEVTIADLLKTVGYRTACIGKWHLGHLPEFLPTRQGFDSYLGIPYSNDMGVDRAMKISKDVVWTDGKNEADFKAAKGRGGGPPLMRDEEVIEWPLDQSQLTRRYTEAALEFIKANRDNRFFLYFAQTMPHVPLFASERFENKSEGGLYGDTVEEVDWSVGEILKTLKAEGLDENTLVVYTSDNGPWLFKNARPPEKGDGVRRAGGSALPLRGGKFSDWEGGMRVPTVMRWPSRIPAGMPCRELAATIDLLPTIAELVGVPLPTDRVIDGRSIVPLLEGRAGAKTPHEVYFYRKSAVRAGNWKLIRGQLFDLAADIGETRDLAAAHPDVVARLSALLEAHVADVSTHQRPFGTVPAAPK